MTARLGGILVGLLFVGIIAVTPGWTRVARGAGVALDLISTEQRVVDLVNAERAKVGLHVLEVSAPLVISARNYAAYMAAANFFAHVGLDGSTVSSRNQAVGYGDFAWLGENLAAGQTTPEAAMDAWMNSPAHRAVLLSPSPREIGVGFYRGGSYGYYWVQEFGVKPQTYRAVSLPPTPLVAGWSSPATGRAVAGEWLAAFKALGGLDNVGHPRSDVIADPLSGGRKTQYFQRLVLEYHPDNPPAYRVQRRLLADILYPGADSPVDPREGPPGPHHYFPFTPGRPTGLGHFVADYTRSGSAIYFKEYFDRHGGIDAFGYPKEEPKLREGRWTQRFQAAVFEYHPENDRDGLLPGSSIPYRNYRVQLALLGDEYMARNGLPYR